MMAAAAPHGRSVPWVEKYRPQKLDAVEGQPQVIEVLRATLTSQNLPHLLFYGPPGTGKTSTVLALARDLFGTEAFRSRVLELNASDERGISVVRDKIKVFAQAAAAPAHPGAPSFKIVLLDEADSLTADAQTALRRVMETYARTTRFCIVCNYVSRIIEPLASRCAKFRFVPVARQAALGRLEHIARSEGVALADENALSAVLDTAEGDLRRAITLLQTAHRLSSARGTPVDAASIVDLAGVAPASLVNAAISVVLDSTQLTNAEGNARGHASKIMAFVRTAVVGGGHSSASLLRELSARLISEPSVPAARRALCALWIAQADTRIADGGSEYIQLCALLTTLSQIVSLPPNTPQHLLLPNQV